MKRPYYAEVVRRFVREARIEPTPSVPTDKRRMVAAVEEALRARARRRSRLRPAAGLMLGAAAVAVVLGGRALMHRVPAPGSAGTSAPVATLTVLGAGEDGRGELIAGDSRHRPLQRGMALDAGVRVVAPPSAEVKIGAARGTLLALEPLGELTVTEANTTQRYELRAGALRAHVARIFAGERFIIDTPDAEVEVHGTAFRVAVVAADPRCGGGTRTRVAVSEGVVSVRSDGRETQVFPGDVWPGGCASAPSASRGDLSRPAAPGARGAPVERPRHHQASAPSERPVEATPPSASAPAVAAKAVTEASALAAENDLFAAAALAKNRGQLAEAARLFGKLATEHPRSPLLESATVQRMKALGAIDVRAGAEAAAAYLARFPGGFARPDAEKLLSRSSP